MESGFGGVLTESKNDAKLMAGGSSSSVIQELIPESETIALSLKHSDKICDY